MSALLVSVYPFGLFLAALRSEIRPAENAARQGYRGSELDVRLAIAFVGLRSGGRVA